MRATESVSNGARRLALCLGTLATGASIAITFFAGRERGGAVWEQAVWIAIGVTLLLAAHFLPAISSGANVPVRLLAWVLWAAAMVSTGYSHGTFFWQLNSTPGTSGRKRSQCLRCPLTVPRAEAK